MLKALKVLKIIYNDCKQWNKKGFATEYSVTTLDEAIKELEELNNRSCERCKHFDSHSEVCYEPVQNQINSSSFICIDSDSFYCSKYEAKVLYGK